MYAVYIHAVVLFVTLLAHMYVFPVFYSVPMDIDGFAFILIMSLFLSCSFSF